MHLECWVMVLVHKYVDCDYRPPRYDGSDSVPFILQLIQHLLQHIPLWISLGAPVLKIATESRGGVESLVFGSQLVLEPLEGKKNRVSLHVRGLYKSILSFFHKKENCFCFMTTTHVILFKKTRKELFRNVKLV